MKKLFIIIVLVTAVFNKLSAEAAGRPIDVAFNWEPQAEFAGFYVAKEKGYYADFGLDVNFKYCHGSGKAAEMLKNKKADFATISLLGAIVENSKGANLVNIAQLMQKSPILFVARKSSGISAPKDLDGKKIALWRSVETSTPEAFFKKFNIKPKIVPVNSGIDLFIMGGVDALIVMSYNEYHSILNSGLDSDELVKFSFADYGLNIPYTGIYCTDETYNEDEILCRNFVEATLKGWAFAFKEPEKTLSMIIKEMKKHKKPANNAHQRWMLLKMKDLFSLDKNKRIDTCLSNKDFLAAEKILMDSRVINKNIDFRKFNKTGGTNAKE